MPTAVLYVTVQFQYKFYVLEYFILSEFIVSHIWQQAPFHLKVSAPNLIQFSFALYQNELGPTFL